MSCQDSIGWLKIILLNIVLNIFNLVTTFVNIHYLYEQGEVGFAFFSLILLWFPGIITSGAFVILYWHGNKAVSDLETKYLVLWPLALLFFYPVVPLFLTLYYLYSRDEDIHQMARLARLFAAFLDHGPQFVLRLVIVVLYGLAHSGTYNRDDVVFIMSMISTFSSLVMSGLYFNERKTSWGVWLFLSMPMFSAIFGCRAFTLAVFLRVTTEVEAPASHQLLCLAIIILMFISNILLFRVCHQDWIRSVVFGICSLLLPVGYGNDVPYYQLPNQKLSRNTDQYVISSSRVRRENPSNQIIDEMTAHAHESELTGSTCLEEATEEESFTLTPMKSGKFLLLDTVSNTLLVSSCAIYIYINTNISNQVDDALIIPQILAVIPGLLFSVGRSFLYQDICPVYEDNDTRMERACGVLRKGVRIALAVLFSLLGFSSFAPAIFWVVVYKTFTADDVKTAVYNGIKNDGD